MRSTKRLTYANVVSTVALVLVVGAGGTAVAAGALAKDSVGTKQLKAGAVKTVDLAGNAVDSAKVKNGALTGADVKNGSLTGADLDLAMPTVVSGVGSESGDLTGVPTTIATVDLTAPAAGFVVVTGEATFRADEATTWLEAYLIMDGENQRYTYWETGDADDFYDETNTMSVVVPVTAGTHTFALSVAEHDSSNFGGYWRPQVTAQYFPEGSAAVQPPTEPEF